MKKNKNYICRGNYLAALAHAGIFRGEGKSGLPREGLEGGRRVSICHFHQIDKKVSCILCVSLTSFLQVPQKSYPLRFYTYYDLLHLVHAQKRQNDAPLISFILSLYAAVGLRGRSPRMPEKFSKICKKSMKNLQILKILKETLLFFQNFLKYYRIFVENLDKNQKILEIYICRGFGG